MPTTEEQRREVVISALTEIALDIGPVAIDPETNLVAVRPTWPA